MKPVVLLVDDEVSIVKAMRRALRSEGYELCLAGNGQEALKTLGERNIDVIVSDYRMPGMSGTELLTEVRNRHPSTIRIMLTGEADLQAVIAAINDGAIYKFLTKPWCNDNLRATLKEACTKATQEHTSTLEASSHANFCNQMLGLAGPAAIVVLELRNPGILRLLSSTQLKLFEVEIEQVVERSLALLTRVVQLEDAHFAFGAGITEKDIWQSLMRELERPIDLGGQIVSPRFALGVAPCDAGLNAITVQEYLRDALIAVSASSFAGEVTVFSSGIEDSLQERHSLEQDMQHGLKRDEFYVQLQPQVNAQDEKIEAVETLCRWRHATRGVVSPLKFIDLAERNGFIHELGAWVIDQSFRILEDLKELGFDGLRVSVNVSPRQFCHSEWVDAALAFAAKTQRPELLELEITESTVMDDPERAIRVMNHLKEAGFCLAMDDFGTGQSSLALLNQLPVDALKFDRSLVSNITTNARSRTLFTRLLEMTHELGVKSIVEGVETREQVELCREVGCHLIQGFYFYRPMEVGDFYEHLGRKSDG